ncbi:MAG: hypothetical protein HQL24_09260 [Candidatus Omnitrophica bacterium]|nr:hypothetical protein [Candidatus Omnitrophota bacterium]
MTRSLCFCFIFVLFFSSTICSSALADSPASAQDNILKKAGELIEKKEYLPAAQTIEAALSASQNDASLIEMLIGIYIYLNDDKALKYYDILKLKEPLRAESLRNLAIMSRIGGVLEIKKDAISLIFPSGDAPKDPDILTKIRSAQYLDSEANYKYAIRAYEGILRDYKFSNSEKGGIYWTIGALYGSYGQSKDSLIYLQKAFELEENVAEKVYLLEAYFALNDYKKCLAYVKRGLHKSPDDKIYLYYGGKTALAMKDAKLLRSYWDKLKTLDPLLYAFLEKGNEEFLKEQQR